MKPGKYFKDSNRITMIEISKVEEGLAWGKSHLLKKQGFNGVKTITIDERDKFWVVAMHQWSPYNQGLVMFDLEEES